MNKKGLERASFWEKSINFANFGQISTKLKFSVVSWRFGGMVGGRANSDGGRAL